MWFDFLSFLLSPFWFKLNFTLFKREAARIIGPEQYKYRSHINNIDESDQELMVNFWLLQDH
jgi:hypothetical protein